MHRAIPACYTGPQSRLANLPRAGASMRLPVLPLPDDVGARVLVIGAGIGERARRRGRSGRGSVASMGTGCRGAVGLGARGAVP
jgi:hypothetical protein